MASAPAWAKMIGMILFREFEIKTGGCLDAVDLTEDVAEVVSASGVVNGSVLVCSPHTTCCVLLATPGPDTTEALERTMKALASPDDYYFHDDLTIRTENLVEDEPANAPAHIAHAFLGRSSECVPILQGKVLLGEDQRVLLLELDCSRVRRYYVQVTGE
ncbi:MAG: YjbQ family protein [Actinomycetota bacterium]|nr:YjbQ family protein [Actinomycetota bacterium]